MIKLNFDTQLVNSYLERRDFDKIIDDKDLFLTVFYKIYKGENDSHYKVSVLGNKIVVEGFRGPIKTTERCIENIRRILVDSKKEASPSVNILAIDPGTKIDTNLVKEKSVINANNFDINTSLPSDWYNSLILPNLPILAETYGLVFSQTTKSQCIQQLFSAETKNQEVSVLHFEWSKNDYTVYPIPPKVIKEPENLGLAVYQMYQNQVLCDFKLSTQNQDSKTFKVHSNILYLNGGPILQQMLTGLFKEGQEKSIYFKDYSSQTIDDFVKFVYLGAKAFSHQYVSSSKDVDIFELFRFAHAFQVTPLIDCCTNIISLLATSENKKDIQSLAEQYKSEHLAQLYEHLNKSA